MKHASPMFPHPSTADDTGLVTVTADLTADLLLAAYSQGMFPWTDNPVGWYSPDPRAVFIRERIHLPKNLPKLARRARFTTTFDTAFAQVMSSCATAHADDGVWISPRFVRAFTALHERGYAHSVEVWQDNRLVGGLYGVHIGRFFAGESMFYHVSNASKVAFAALLRQLDRMGVYLIDAQVLNNHTANLGAVWVHRADYLRVLAEAVKQPCGFAGKLWPALDPA